MKIIASFIPLLMSMLLCSCKKESINSPESQINIYMAGCVWETPSAAAMATYWKNGKPVTLNGSSNNSKHFKPKQ